MTERTESRSVAMISKQKKKLELPGSCGNISPASPSSSVKGDIFPSFFIAQSSAYPDEGKCSKRKNFPQRRRIYTNLEKIRKSA